MTDSVRATVLRTLPYGDTSLIIRLLTPDFGVITVMARGLRSARRKNSGVPQLFSSGTLTVQLKENRTMHPLRDFTPDRVRLGLSASLARLAGASLLADLVLRHSEHDPQEHVAYLFEQALDFLESTPDEDLDTAVLQCAWGIVAALGYQPHFESCVECSRAFQADEIGRFDFARGGVGCPDCTTSGPRLGPIARAEMSALIAWSASMPAPGEEKQLVPIARVEPHLRMLGDFASYHVADGRRITAFEYFLEAMQS